jgi:hypothetical protein
VSSQADATGFLAPVSYAVDKRPIAAVVGDFNNDGIPDLAVANQSSSDVSALLGNGDGTFQSGKTFVVGKAPQALAVGDFNGDGNLDIVTADSGDITLLFGKGNGTFKNPPVTLTLPNVVANQDPQAPVAVAVGDFNHDGKLDLAVTAEASFVGGQKGFLDVLLGHGDGTFTIGSVTPINSSSPLSLALADFNGDGNLDAVAGNFVDRVGVPGGGGISVLSGKGDGTLQEGTDAYAGISGVPMAVAVGDFNGDRKPDLVVTGIVNAGGTEQGVVSVLLGNGDGTFQAPQLFAAGYFPQAVGVGDFNRDGKLDVVTVSGGNVSVLLGNGNGTFVAPLSFTRPLNPSGLAVGDFNRDGFPDLAVTSITSNTFDVLINTGTWGAPAATAATTASGPTPSSTSSASLRATAARSASLAPAKPSATVVGALDWFLAELGHEDQLDSANTPWAATGWWRNVGPRRSVTTSEASHARQSRP